MQNLQQQQQQPQGVQYWPHGPGVYNLGLEMGQHIDVIAIYWQHRYHRAFPGPTATRCCSCSITRKSS